MSYKLGPERATMISPSGWGSFVLGTDNINTKLAQGWAIVDSDRNHLLRDMVTADEKKEEVKEVKKRGRPKKTT
jgi:hypothetical protein